MNDAAISDQMNSLNNACLLLRCTVADATCCRLALLQQGEGADRNEACAFRRHPEP